MLWGRILTAELASNICSSTHTVWGWMGECISHDCTRECVRVLLLHPKSKLNKYRRVSDLHMKTAALNRKMVKEPHLETLQSTLFVCLFPPKQAQTQQFTRGGMLLCCDFTLYSPLRCLKKASDKYWMSKRQHHSFKCWGGRSDASRYTGGVCGIFGDFSFLHVK